MRFSEFFNEWLYGKDGYYATFKQIGKSGDFFTAVSVSPLFGGAIANYIYKKIQSGWLSPNAKIVEIGAHQGYLLADIVQFLYTFDPKLINSLSFAIIEPFEHLQKAQRDYFAKSFGDAIELEHYKNLDEIRAKEAFVVANEIFDAFACELFYKGKMAYVKDFEIVWQEADEPVAEIAKKYGFEKGEVAVGYEKFAASMYRAFERFEFVTFDYGQEFARNEFSLRIYTKHQVYPFFDEEVDLKKLYKRSDLTYDVHFGYLIDAFEVSGLRKKAYKTQAGALIDFGIMELLEKILQTKGYEIYWQQMQKVKILIAPNQMGERFKMVSFIKE